NAGVACVIRAVRLAIDLCRLGAEHILQHPERLGAQLIAVADEKRTSQLSSVGKAFEKVHCNESLPRTGGERQYGAFRLFALLTTRKFLQDGTDSGILIVTPGCLPTGIASQQRAGRHVRKTEAHPSLVAVP